MSRKCDITNIAVTAGNNVSHSNRKTKRRFIPNLHTMSFESEALKQKLHLKVAVRTLRSIEFKGGLDNFLLSQSARKLTEKARNLKNKIRKSLSTTGVSQENT